MVSETSITVDEKQKALDQIVNSETFARSEQLRHFLRYVCDMDISGRRGEINEYLVGVEVLRRPQGYSPANDSSVRTRAYELRQKLERYYSTEGTDTPVRMELPKGSYTPVFVRNLISGSPVAPVLPLGPPSIEVKVAGSPRWHVPAAFVAGVLLALAIGTLWVHERIAPRVDPIVREAWGPLAQPSANVLICVGSTLHLVVRPQFDQIPNNTKKYPAFEDLYPLFRKQRPLRDGVQLFMHPSENAVDFGAVRAAVIASETLKSFGATYQLLPERSAPLAALRGRNAIVIGNAQDSNAAAQELLRAVWTIDFDSASQRMSIIDQSVQGRPTSFTRSQGPPGAPSWCCGLITVLPSLGTSGTLRTIIFSGITSVGVQAAMEYFASPAALAELRGRFARENVHGFPAAYQVVVKCQSKDNSLLADEYAAYRILKR